MIEPLDDELGDFVGAFKQVERPTATARAATWAAIDARLAADDAAARRHVWPVLVAIAAAVALCIGAAAVIARGTRTANDVAASHHAGPPSPAPVEPPRTGPPAPLAPRVESVAPRVEPERLEPTAPRSTKSDRRPRPASAPSLRPEEVASFHRAQAALAEERAADALHALDEHGRRFPGGLFEEERQLSRAAALCLLGRTTDARAARDRFLRAHPGSHLTERARSICREIE